MELQRALSCFIVAAVAAFLSGLSSPALGDDCGLLGGAINGSGECEISSTVAKTGTYNLDETLHVTGAGRIDASNASLAGITLNICVAPATPSTSCDLILDTPSPLVTPPALGGGQIEADDISGNDNASPITIKVSRDVLMGPNSAILAANTVSGGKGGKVTIAAGRNMTMNGGATISVTGTGSSGNSPAGSIDITVGNYPSSPGVGIFTMDPTSQILANSPAASAGAIAISAGAQMDINGLVQSSSRLSATTPATQPPGGGTITLVSACNLTVGDTGKVSSEGKDPGADLVHLEGCEVVIHGLVQSIAVLGGGHALPVNPPNHCNSDTAAHPTFGPPSPPALNPGRYTTCVEIWGNHVTIDATGTHHGEVAADGVRTDTGGPMRSWIDIFAKSDINIIADTTGNYAVHSNPDSATNDYAGLITIKSQAGKIVTTALVPGTKGLAIQANGTSAGSKGGDIIVQAGGASPNGQVDFTADSVQAIGASSGGSPAGGHISVQSFNDTILGASPGELNAAGGGTAGSVTLTACVGDPATTYAGTVTGPETDSGPGVCGGAPSFPTVAHFLTGLNVTDFFVNRQTLWTSCSSQPTVSGQKFNDLGNDGVKDAGDPGVQGVQIHIFDKATGGTTLHQEVLTDASGNYSFTVPAGEYIVCEQGGPAPASPAQTFPTSDASGGACATHVGVTGSRGYDIVLAANDNLAGRDFGNFFGGANGTIGGQKFNDLAGDGVKDAGDPGVEGFQIHIFDKATSGATLHQDTLTDASGNYSFSVPPGEYIVCEQGGPAPASPQQTFPASDASGGACATHAGIAGSRGYDIVLTSNQTVTGQDFGNFFGGTISGHKFSDLNGNGTQDAGDPPVAGLQIHLFDKATGGSAVHLETLTDASGNYTFGPLQPGEYMVCEQGGPGSPTPQTFPASDGSGGACATHVGVAGSRGYDVVLTANQAVTGQDFGNDPGLPPPPPPPGPPQAIPTLGDFALLAVAALLALSGAIALPRRRREQVKASSPREERNARS